MVFLIGRLNPFFGLSTTSCNKKQIFLEVPPIDTSVSRFADLSLHTFDGCSIETRSEIAGKSSGCSKGSVWASLPASL
jgi:hypothetical protein